MWDWYPLTDPDFMLSVLTCNSFDVWNDTGYCSKAYDTLYSQQSAAMNPAQRRQVVYQMQQMMYTDRPYIMLNYVNVLEAHSKQWSGFLESPQSAFNPLSIQTMTQVHQVG